MSDNVVNSGSNKGLLAADLSVTELSADRALSMLSASGVASWRQYPAYCEVAAQSDGASNIYLQLSAQGTPLAITNMRTKSLPLLSTGIAMIAQGPVLLGQQGGNIQQIYDALRQHITQNMGLTLRINPPVVFGDMAARLSDIDGFQTMPESRYHSFIIDLQPGLEALRARLNGKWRTDLRRGEREKEAGRISITRSGKAQDIRAFQPLLSELAGKKGFIAPQDAQFFADVASKSRGGEHYAAHLAWHGDDLIGGHIGAYSGNMAVYLLGATNDKGRDLRASFLLQWAAIEYAIKRGLNYYDLGGADEAENPSVFRFKKRMGGQYYEGPSKMEARAPWPKGQIVDLAEKAYKRLKG